MDLRSGKSNGSFNPFTSLIQYEGGWLDREFTGVPMITEPALDDGSGRWVHSTILHELTHLAAFMATRLGVVVRLASAQMLHDWRTANVAQVSEKTAAFIGTFTPLLEGLAMYAELDYDLHEDRVALYTPAKLFTEIAAAGRQIAPTALMQAVRLTQVSELYRYKGPGLLRLLLATPETGAQYSVGYLWVKALAGTLAQRCPALKAPQVMLPFLIRVLCDHPVIYEAYQDRIEPSQAIKHIRSTVLSWTPAQFDRLTRSLETSQFQEAFDGVHVIEFIAGKTLDEAMFRENDADLLQLIEGLSHGQRSWMNQVTAASRVHFLDCTHGILHSIAATSDIVLRDELSSDLFKCELPSLTAVIEKMYGALEVPHEIPLDDALSIAAWMETRFYRFAARCAGHLVTLARYMTLSDPHDAGVVLWGQGRGMSEPQAMFMSQTASGLLSLDNLTLVRSAFTVSIAERLELARRLTDTGSAWPACACATRLLAADLVANETSQAALATGGIPAVLTDDQAQHFSRWTAGADDWRLDSELLAGPAAVFDLPGFKALATPLSFASLLPRIRDQ